jgi:hypothetical protein
MSGERGFDQDFMLGLKTAEVAYGSTATAVNSSNFVRMRGYSPDLAPDKFADQVYNDSDTVNGSEYATEQEIVHKRVEFKYTEPRARPGTIIGLMALAEGGTTPTKDGAVDAWRHVIEECATGTSLKSVNGIWRKGDYQILMKGLKVKGWELSMEEEGGVNFSADFIGSGYRATNADSFVSYSSEPRLYSKYAAVRHEEGANISISGTLTQGAENISSATPTDIGPRAKSWKITRSLNMTGEGGFGGGDYLQDADYARRQIELALTLRYLDAAEMDYYESQTNLAFELDCVHSSLVAVGGTYYWGFKFVLPLGKLKEAPAAEGGIADKLTRNYNVTLLADGTNKIFKFVGYNAIAAYLA